MPHKYELKYMPTNNVLFITFILKGDSKSLNRRRLIN